jgi:hypothetical protein
MLDGLLDEPIRISLTSQDRLGNSKGHDAVIGSKAAFGKQRKLFAPVVVEFKA